MATMDTINRAIAGAYLNAFATALNSGNPEVAKAFTQAIEEYNSGKPISNPDLAKGFTAITRSYPIEQGGMSSARLGQVYDQFNQDAIPGTGEKIFEAGVKLGMAYIGGSALGSMMGGTAAAGETAAAGTAGTTAAGTTAAGTTTAGTTAAGTAGTGTSILGSLSAANQFITDLPGTKQQAKDIAGFAMTTGGTLLGGQQAKEAASETAAAQVEAARIAAEAQKFRPVGVATRFGESRFGYDAQGNLISAGYELSPELKAQQDALMGLSGDYLSQYQAAMGAAAPMGAGAQTMMGLGQQYLARTPEEQAAMYMEQQRALVAPGQERSLAALQARLQAQGRGGLAIGGTTSGMRAASPEMEAYYNALLQQERELAARATQGGMDYAKFGAGMLGAGGEMLQGMYGTQQAAYQPYATALGGAAGLEQLGAQPLTLGTEIGARTTAGTAAAGRLLGSGVEQAALTTQPTRSISPWADILSGAGRALGSY